MYLRSLTLKGFKSFPERTHLEFGPGVSVVIGPNGSGKSNITDAVLWALGEQSPLAVRGSSMQDVIFGGGPGLQPRGAAEVEIVLDNDDGTVGLPLSEISILRRIERSGEGEYRLGGARCRLIDVIEALSDTGLGKETHSIVSQGRIESIVTSKPRDRRMLIEEAAGLSKHRKRRRRAQLKLERTQQNLDRALDVEREARSRLRPLARQAQAAELHERLERQTLQARLELTRHRWLAVSAELDAAQALVARERDARAKLDGELAEVLARREAVERSLAERSEERDALTQRLYGARSALERLRVRGEQARTLAESLRERITAGESELERLAASAREGEQPAAGAEAERRVQELEQELEGLRASHRETLESETAELERERSSLTTERERLEAELAEAKDAKRSAAERVREERASRSWERGWAEVRSVIADGVRRLLGLADRDRDEAMSDVVEHAERVARGVLEHALGQVEAAEEALERSEQELRAREQELTELSERERQAAWSIENRRAAVEHGPLALRTAQLDGELAAERRQLERIASERSELAARVDALRTRCAADRVLAPLATRLAESIDAASEHASARSAELHAKLADEGSAGAQIAEQLRACAQEEAEVQGALRAAGEAVTTAEVDAQRSVDRAAEVEGELREIAQQLGFTAEQAIERDGPEPTDEELEALQARIERLARRREQLGPVNPLAQDEYAEAQAHVQELATQREDLETAMRELRAIIGEADKQIRETFEATFESVATNFSDVIGEVFPGGSGRLRLVADDVATRPVLGDAASSEEASGAGDGGGEESEPEDAHASEEPLLGVEIEVTPAGKSTKRLSLLSGGEKAMTALAFLFAVFLARPCPFYVLDEVEAALDEHNLERFLALLRRCASRAQFIVITHQKRTMEAANWLYGVSMGRDGASKVISRRLDPAESGAPREDADAPREWADVPPGASANVAAELRALSAQS